MRRADRELKAIEDIIAVLNKNKVMRLAMTDGDMPYIVPLNYGFVYENGAVTVYFHCACEGRKLDILAKNNNVCFETDGGHELITGKTDCAYSFRYESVIGTGKCFPVTDEGEKLRALACLMKQQTGEDREFSFAPDEVSHTCIYKIISENITGKARR